MRPRCSGPDANPPIDPGRRQRDGQRVERGIAGRHVERDAEQRGTDHERDAGRPPGAARNSASGCGGRAAPCRPGRAAGRATRQLTRRPDPARALRCRVDSPCREGGGLRASSPPLVAVRQGQPHGVVVGHQLERHDAGWRGRCTITSLFIESTRLRAATWSTSVTSASHIDDSFGVSSGTGTIGRVRLVLDLRGVPQHVDVAQHLRAADLVDPTDRPPAGRAPRRGTARRPAARWAGSACLTHFGVTIAGRWSTSWRVISQEMPP